MSRDKKKIAEEIYSLILNKFTIFKYSLRILYISL